MQNLEDIAKLKAKVDPQKFLGLLSSIAKRTEHGRSESISITECRGWGFSPEEAVPYLLLLVETGILRQKVQVYDDIDEAFEDYRGQVNLDDIPPEQIHMWFLPTVSGKEFSRFFVPAPH